MLKLYYAPGACSLIAHIVLEELGVPYEAEPVFFNTGDHRKPEFLRVNPKGKVPVLVTDRGPLTELPAILTYLAQTHPDAGLLPVGDPFAMAQVQAFNVYLATTVHITFRQISVPTFYADGEQARAALAAKVPEKADEHFALVEEQLSDGRPWIHGDHYTLSDPYAGVFATHWQRPGMGHPERFPLIAAHRERVLGRPAVKRALADEGLGDAWWSGDLGSRK